MRCTPVLTVLIFHRRCSLLLSFLLLRLRAWLPLSGLSPLSLLLLLVLILPGVREVVLVRVALHLAPVVQRLVRVDARVRHEGGVVAVEEQVMHQANEIGAQGTG